MKKYLPYIAVAIICILATFSVTKACNPPEKADYKPVIKKLQEAKIEILDSVSKIQSQRNEILADQKAISEAHEKIQSKPITNPIADSLARATIKNFPRVKQRQP